jgi:integrase
MPLPRGIRQRGASFCVDVTINGTRKTGTRDTAEEAIALHAKLRADLLNGTAETPKRDSAWTLGDAFDRTAALYWKGAKAEAKLIANGLSAVNHFGRTMLVRDLNTDALDGYVLKLQAGGNSNSTVNRKLAAISKMLHVAVDRDKLTKVPKLPRQKEPKGRVRYLTEVEETAILSLLDAWDQPVLKDAFILLVDTGIRRGEMFSLVPEWVGEDGKSITLWENKNDTPRTVPLTLRAQEVVARRMEGVTQGRPLFAFSPRWLNANWDRVRWHLELDDVTPHIFRHTCASRLVQRGVALAVVQQWLGHKTITVTLRYSHLAPTSLSDAVNVLEPQDGYNSRAKSVEEAAEHARSNVETVERRRRAVLRQAVLWCARGVHL